MNPWKAGLRRFPVSFPDIILSLVLLAIAGWAQVATSAWAQAPAGEGARATQEQTEQKISPQEAERLFHSVDEILGFASKDTLFPIKREVKRQLVSRDEVADYVTKHNSEDEDAKRLR